MNPNEPREEGRLQVPTLADIFEISSRLGVMTGDPPNLESLVGRPNTGEASEFWKVVDELISAIILLPAHVGMRGLFASMEAINVRLACQECEYRFRDSENRVTDDLKISVMRLDAALTRFRMLVG
jgi:hypothetical protein